MSQGTKSYVIVGAGEAGIAAAHTLRAADSEARIVVLNNEAVTPYERPPLSKQVLTGNEPVVPTKIRPENWFAEQKVELLSSTEVREIEPTLQYVTTEQHGQKQTIPYDKLLLATGARVRKIPSLKESRNVQYLRSWADSEKLKARLSSARSVLIVGGGVIGLEVASSARELGKSVTVVELNSRLMARALSPEVSDYMLSLHQRNGVDIKLDVESVDLSNIKDGVRCVTGAGDDFECDLAVIGIGAIPNAELAQRAGCEVKNGILVDELGKTSVINIYAAGDVAAFPHPHYQRVLRLETWKHAQRHGAYVGQAMITDEGAYAALPWFWTDQHGVNFQVTGLVSESSKTVWRNLDNAKTALHFDGDRLIGATTIDNGREMRPLSNLIAASWQGDVERLTATDEPFRKICNQLLSEMEI